MNIDRNEEYIMKGLCANIVKEMPLWNDFRFRNGYNLIMFISCVNIWLFHVCDGTMAAICLGGFHPHSKIIPSSIFTVKYSKSKWWFHVWNMEFPPFSTFNVFWCFECLQFVHIRCERLRRALQYPHQINNFHFISYSALP